MLPSFTNMSSDFVLTHMLGLSPDKVLPHPDQLQPIMYLKKRRYGNLGGGAKYFIDCSIYQKSPENIKTELLLRNVNSQNTTSLRSLTTPPISAIFLRTLSSAKYHITTVSNDTSDKCNFST